MLNTASAIFTSIFLAVHSSDKQKGAVKKINTQARATILWKLGLVDAAKKEA